MVSSDQDFKRLWDELYERFGKQLEAEHLGKYVVIFPDGQVVLGNGLYETAKIAVETIGRGGFIYKVGEGVTGRVR
jgi:hypothetical protein